MAKLTNMITDPYLTTSEQLARLDAEYKKHGNLCIALDFDNTIFDYHKKGVKYPKIINLIKDCNKLGMKVFIYSGSAKERYPFIREYCEEIGIKIEGINQDIIDWHPNQNDLDWSSSKCFYNIFLDDRAGMGQAYEVLRMLVDRYIQHDIDIFEPEIKKEGLFTNVNPAIDVHYYHSLIIFLSAIIAVLFAYMVYNSYITSN